MKHVIGAAAAVWLAILIACGGGPRRSPSETFPPDKMKRDWTVIGIAMQGNTCKVMQAKPEDMRVSAGDDLMWFVDGDCADVDIEINPVVMDAQGSEHRITNTQNLKKKARHKERLSTRLQNELPAGKYTYEIRINGQPAEYRSPAQRGAFVICPDWPCS
jgi:hypothetical protein